MDPENCILMKRVYVLCNQIFSHWLHAKTAWPNRFFRGALSNESKILLFLVPLRTHQERVKHDGIGLLSPLTLWDYFL